jgi:hypothetical protein
MLEDLKQDQVTLQEAIRCPRKKDDQVKNVPVLRQVSWDTVVSRVLHCTQQTGPIYRDASGQPVFSIKCNCNKIDTYDNQLKENSFFRDRELSKGGVGLVQLLLR